jgi:hypothetical protein
MNELTCSLCGFGVQHEDSVVAAWGSDREAYVPFLGDLRVHGVVGYMHVACYVEQRGVDPFLGLLRTHELKESRGPRRLLHRTIDPKTGESVNRSHRLEFEEAFLASAKRAFAEWDTPAGRPVWGFTAFEPELLRARGKGTRLFVPFRSESHPGQLFRYWEYVWEIVAWEEWYGASADVTGRTGLGWNFISLSFADFLHAASVGVDWITEVTDLDEQNVRWIRAAVVW